jgi:IS1 family transposase
MRIDEKIKNEVLNKGENVTYVITKSETYLVESYNFVLRYYLTKVHRKTKYY